jgi:hypothetical protein
LKLHLDGVHEQAGLAGDFLVCHTLGSENCRKTGHFRSPETVRLFAVKPQKRFGATFYVSGAPIGRELQQRHAISILSGESPRDRSTLAVSPSQRLNDWRYLVQGRWMSRPSLRRRQPFAVSRLAELPELTLGNSCRPGFARLPKAHTAIAARLRT